MMEALKLQCVTKAFGKLIVMQDFSLELRPGEPVAVLGPSGCGKTTVLRLLAGLEQPDAGRVVGAQGRRQAVVFQEDRLLEALTAKDNLLAVLPKDSGALADLCLEHCGLKAAAELYPQQMSGGMKRRLAVARAVAFNGDILLLDEPYKGLDDTTKAQIMDFVANRHLLPGMKQAGEVVTVLVTHGEEEARAMAKRVLRLEGPPLAVAKDSFVTK